MKVTLYQSWPISLTSLINSFLILDIENLVSIDWKIYVYVTLINCYVIMINLARDRGEGA